MRGLFDTPELGPCTVSLHPYQEEAVAAVSREFRKGTQRTLLSMATGTGKTIVAAYIGRKCVEAGRDIKVLFLAHTEELIQQTADKFDLLGVEVGVEQAGQFADAVFPAQVVVGSVATLMQTGRLMSFAPDHFDYVIIDEGHRALADSYKKIMAHFSRAKVLVMTATPVRLDGQAIDYVCQTLAYKFSILDAWKAGKRDGRQYLCDIKVRTPELGIDPKALRRKKGDLTDRDYDARVAATIGMICNKIREFVADEQAIQFWSSIRAAQLAAHVQDEWYPSEAVWGADPDRRDKIARFRAAGIRHMANQALFIEGFDVPNVSAVVLAAHTNSWSRLLQKIGRGLRPGKPFCTVLDLFGLTREFGEGKDGWLAQPLDILGKPGFDREMDELKKIMAEFMARDPELTLMNAVEQAEEEQVRRRKKQYAIRISIAERQVECPEETYIASEVFGEGGVGRESLPSAPQANSRPATDGQKRFLRFLGCGDEVERFSFTRAQGHIVYLKRQRDAGKSHLWQRKKLARKGVEMAEARDMSHEAAGDALAQWDNRRDDVYGRRSR